ncbi:hypothetical protein NEIG_02658 [Nematocida sp. ERTm5]|nr:hypothetical protein NEIG_02658 [Nematocida sp. ERTm5]
MFSLLYVFMFSSLLYVAILNTVIYKLYIDKSVGVLPSFSLVCIEVYIDSTKKSENSMPLHLSVFASNCNDLISSLLISNLLAFDCFSPFLSTVVRLSPCFISISNTLCNLEHSLDSVNSHSLNIASFEVILASNSGKRSFLHSILMAGLKRSLSTAYSPAIIIWLFSISI